MKRNIQYLILFLTLYLSFSAKVYAQQKLYDEQINPMEQIDKALAQAKQQGKHVICQLVATGAFGASVLQTSSLRIQP